MSRAQIREARSSSACCAFCQIDNNGFHFILNSIKNYVPRIENMQLYISCHVGFSCMQQFFDISFHMKFLRILKVFCI